MGKHDASNLAILFLIFVGALIFIKKEIYFICDISICRRVAVSSNSTESADKKKHHY